MATSTETTDDAQQAAKRIRELERENADLTRKVEQYKPTANIRHLLFYDVETVAAYYTRQELADMVYEDMARQNMDRRQRGLDPIRFDDDELDDRIEEKKRQIVAAFTRPPTNRPGRVITMYDPKTDTLRSVPVESQINNMAGSLADGVVRYQNKGWKYTDPFICARKGCRREAALNGDGEWAFEGYCSGEHRDQVESAHRSSAPAAVITQDVMNRVRG